MKYFFVLGNHPALSLAELYAVLTDKVNYLSLTNNCLIVEAAGFLSSVAPMDIGAKGEDLTNLIKRLGGTIKVGEIIDQIPDLSNERVKMALKKVLALAVKPFFGVSLYASSTSLTTGGRHDFRPVALSVKKEIKIANRAPRYVISREPVLSSVVVEQNKLTSGGVEVVLIKDGPSTGSGQPKYWLGRTVAVQPFKDLEKRDYGRPARDDASGMLPPKLAQIMINLAQAKASDTILDPFCGSGTVISEAMAMGYESLIGTDISSKAISDTGKNIEWLERSSKSKAQNQIQSSKFFILDVKQLNQKIESNSIDKIITEPYLGPQRGKIDIKKVVVELNNLYSLALDQFFKVLQPNGRVVMVWPAFLKQTTGKPGEALENLHPDLRNWKIVCPLPAALWKLPGVKLTARNTIIYGRENQKVWREIIILEKN